MPNPPPPEQLAELISLADAPIPFTHAGFLKVKEALGKLGDWATQELKADIFELSRSVPQDYSPTIKRKQAALGALVRGRGR